MGWIFLKSGSTRSTPARCLSTAAMRGIGVVGRRLGRRPRMLHLPRHRHAARRVLRHQLVQDRRPRARQPDDEERRRDRAVRDLRDAAGARPSCAGGSRAGAARRVRAMMRPRVVRRGLALEGVEQEPQRLAEPLAAEVVETRPARRLGQQRRLVEPDERHAERAQRAAGGIERAHAERLHRRRERRCGVAHRRPRGSSVTWLPGGTDSTSQTLPPTTEPRPITVSPPRIVAPA